MRVRGVQLSREVTIVLMLAMAGSAGAQNPAAPLQAPGVPPPDETAGVTVHAVYVPEGLTLDGRLDEPVYAQAPPRSDFIQQEPHEGLPVTEKTDVWVCFDDDNVYIAARLWDSHPERMIANEMRRDASGVYANENFSVILDTFHDNRTGFLFIANILGGMMDGLVTSERDYNGNWNTIWTPKSQRFEQGWTLEMAIPFKSLRYPSAGEQVWGINFRRVVRWKNETSHLTQVPASFAGQAIMRLKQAATLVGLRTPAISRNLEIKPYAISRLATDRLANPPKSKDLSGDVGFDLKYGVTQGLTADFSYNTDFAQVEDDQQQVNLTRFGLFFPEKRDFFLEGQGIFNVGSGNAPGDTPRLFFSRQIGLAGGQPVPITAGGRLTGKTGKFSLGLLGIRTAESKSVAAPSTTFGVVRIRRDVLERSYVGLIATERAPAAGHDNALVGADTGFGFGVTSINAYYAETRTPGKAGNDRSYFGQLSYDADRYGVTLEHLTVGANFNPEIGFLPRQNFRKEYAFLRFSPRPQRLKGVRKLYFQGSFDYITDNDGRLESRVSGLTFTADIDNGDQFSATYTHDYEFLKNSFRVGPDVTIPTGGYTLQPYSISYTLGPTHRPLRGTFGVNRGTYYSGHRDQATYDGRVELSSQFTLEPSISANWFDLPWGRFRINLVSIRSTYMFSPWAQFAALVQYNSGTHTVTSNIRFRWEYVPGSDLFVVYNEGRDTQAPGEFAALQNRTFVVKITRNFRF